MMDSQPSMLTRRLFSGSLLLSAAQLGGYAASFGRNVLLARVLTKTDFGIAAALALTVAAFEVANKMSVSQQIVQSRHGDDPRFVGTAHVCQFLAGMAGALLMAAMAVPMASAFHLSKVSWAFVATSALGAINAFQNMDFMRCMRRLAFGRRAVFDVLPEVMLTIVAVPVVLWLGDYRAVIVLLFTRSAMMLILSHALSAHRYHWDFDRGYLRSIAAFSAPLLLNSVLMFAYQQGDQFLIGSFLSIQSLALYSLAVSITMVPGYMFQYVNNSIVLPFLSGVQADMARFERRYLLSLEISLVASLGIATFTILAGEIVIVMIFGAKYAGAGLVVAWLSVANNLRITRSIAVLAAMARGDTINTVFANVFRTGSLLFAAMALAAERSLPWIAAAGTLGEIAALCAAWVRLAHTTGIPVRTGIARVKPAVLILATAMLLVVYAEPHCPLSVWIPIAISMPIIASFAAWRSFPALRQKATPILEAELSRLA